MDDYEWVTKNGSTRLEKTADKERRDHERDLLQQQTDDIREIRDMMRSNNKGV